MDRDVSRGSSCWTSEDLTVCRERAERGGGAKDVNGGE